MSPTTRWAARARLVLARHPAIRWLSSAVCATAVAWGTATTLAGPARERTAWGTTATAWVATRDLAPGEAIDARQREIPVALVPSGAMTSLGTAGDGEPVAAVPIRAGAILVSDDVAGHGPWALVPHGWRAMAIERHASTLEVQPGDRVEAYWSAGLLAADAVVVAVGDETVTIAVDGDDAAATATALTDPTFVLAFVSERR